jgi:acetyltransferase-like isoleucine patch superfamily enzyme
MIKKLFNKLVQLYHLSNERRFIKYLQAKGIIIGNNTKFYGGVKSINIDITRPSLIEIGENVAFNQNFTLLTHDFVSKVFLHKYDEFLPSSGKVKIGNNVSFGQNCTVLKGVTIGDNCFIGFGSVVTKNIPDNSIAAGIPAKVICSIDEYYEKRKIQCVYEAFIFARSIKERYGRMPIIEDFREEFPLFLNGNEDYPGLPIEKQLGRSFEIYKQKHKALFNGFKDFLEKAELHNHK